MTDSHLYEINLNQGDLLIQLASDDVQFISQQMNKWFELMVDDKYVPVVIPQGLPGDKQEDSAQGSASNASPQPSQQQVLPPMQPMQQLAPNQPYPQQQQQQQQSPAMPMYPPSYDYPQGPQQGYPPYPQQAPQQGYSQQQHQQNQPYPQQQQQHPYPQQPMPQQGYPQQQQNPQQHQQQNQPYPQQQQPNQAYAPNQNTAPNAGMVPPYQAQQQAPQDFQPQRQQPQQAMPETTHGAFQQPVQERVVQLTHDEIEIYEREPFHDDDHGASDESALDDLASSLSDDVEASMQTTLEQMNTPVEDDVDTYIDEPLPEPEPAEVESEPSQQEQVVSGPQADVDDEAKDDFDAVMDTLMKDLEDDEEEDDASAQASNAPSPFRSGAESAEPAQHTMDFSNPSKQTALIDDARSPEPMTVARHTSEMDASSSMSTPQSDSVDLTMVDSLSELCERSSANSSDDFLILSAFFLTEVEGVDKFSLKRVNSLLVKSGLTPVNHSVLENGITQGYLVMVPDLTGMADVSEYAMTDAGQGRAISLL